MTIIDINIDVKNLEECKYELIKLILKAEENLQIGLDVSTISEDDGEIVCIYIDDRLTPFVDCDIPVVIEYLVGTGLTQTNFTFSYNKCDRDLTVFLTRRDYNEEFLVATNGKKK